jgi:copper(I)-binding protein
MNRRIETFCLSVLLLSSAGVVHAAECLPVVGAAWVRLPPVAMPMMAGFARIENPCKATVSVVGAESLAFEEVSLHETREENGVSRMREVANLPIASGKAVELKPGGLHLMLHGPYQPLVVGEKPVITLKLADGRSLPVMFEVRKSGP